MTHLVSHTCLSSRVGAATRRRQVPANLIEADEAAIARSQIEHCHSTVGGRAQ